MIHPDQQARRFWPVRAFVLLFSLGVMAAPAFTKEILKGVEPSENRVYIRTDGLACYFCSFGLERFFKKTGQIAAFDIDMRTGIVEAVFVRGKPLVSSKTLARFVHDAGFTPRWIDAELVGHIEIAADGSALFKVRENGEQIPLENNDALRAYRDGDRQASDVVRVRGRANEDPAFPMRLVPDTIRGEDES